MITASGRILTIEDFRNLDPADLPPSDIQHALHMLPRFCGRGLSVWEHSKYLFLIGARHQISPALKIALLLHDAGEMAGMLDIPAPEKHLPCWAPIVEIQETFQANLFEYYNIRLSTEEHAILKTWDHWAAYLEADHDLRGEARSSVLHAWGRPPAIPPEYRQLWTSGEVRGWHVTLSAVLKAFRAGEL